MRHEQIKDLIVVSWKAMDHYILVQGLSWGHSWPHERLCTKCNLMKAPGPLYYHYKKTLATLDGHMKCHVPHSWKIFGPCYGQEIQSHRRQCNTCRTFLEVTMWENTVESFGFLSAAIYSVQSLASCDREWVSEHGFHGVAGAFTVGSKSGPFMIFGYWCGPGLMWFRAFQEKGSANHMLVSL